MSVNTQSVSVNTELQEMWEDLEAWCDLCGLSCRTSTEQHGSASLRKREKQYKECTCLLVRVALCYYIPKGLRAWSPLDACGGRQLCVDQHAGGHKMKWLVEVKLRC